MGGSLYHTRISIVSRDIVCSHILSSDYNGHLEEIIMLMLMKFLNQYKKQRYM